jgi:hypothetical protein
LQPLENNQSEEWNEIRDDFSETPQEFISEPSKAAIENANAVTTQKIKILSVMHDAKIDEANATAAPNETCAKLFNAYAHPPLFSLNWRHGNLQKIADSIAKELAKNSAWDFDKCADYINEQTRNLRSSINKLGTFAGLLNKIEQLQINAGQELTSNLKFTID